MQFQTKCIAQDSTKLSNFQQADTEDPQHPKEMHPEETCTMGEQNREEGIISV